MQNYGPNFDQRERLELFDWPSFVKFLGLFNLSAVAYGAMMGPAYWVVTFQGQALAAEISEAEIEFAIMAILQPRVADKTREALDINVAPDLRAGSPPWFQAIQAQLLSREITVAQIKTARFEGLGAPAPVPQPLPSNWGGQPFGDHLEQLMNKRSTLLPMDFLERAVHCSKAVAKIVVPVHGKTGYGTGFVISGNLLVTNAHVLGNETDAKGAEVQFNFQRSVNGVDLTPDKVRLDPGKYFKTSLKTLNDLTVVALNEPANGRWIELTLNEENGKRVKVDDSACIIQHPGGEQKQIGMHNNLVTYTDEQLLQYLTDTLPGSSGSPIFDRNWEVVGVHHAGGWLREPTSKRTLFRNEGIRLAKLLDLIK